MAFCIIHSSSFLFFFVSFFFFTSREGGVWWWWRRWGGGLLVLSWSGVRLASALPREGASEAGGFSALPGRLCGANTASGCLCPLLSPFSLFTLSPLSLHLSPSLFLSFPPLSSLFCSHYFGLSHALVIFFQSPDPSLPLFCLSPLFTPSLVLSLSLSLCISPFFPYFLVMVACVFAN